MVVTIEYSLSKSRIICNVESRLISAPFIGWKFSMNPAAFITSQNDQPRRPRLINMANELFIATITALFDVVFDYASIHAAAALLFISSVPPIPSSFMTAFDALSIFPKDFVIALPSPFHAAI
mgnify:CR=1 FL=1